MLARIAATAGTPPTITTDSVVQGGATLQDHWTNGIAQPLVNSGQFTHVVLQGQSMEAVYPDPPFTSMAEQWGQLITAAGARPTLFVTWARAAGDAVYDPSGAWFINPDEMQDRITFGYADVERHVRGSILSCVGEAFRTALRDYPRIGLHQADNSHPTVAGTYLAASTFYVALTGTPVPPAAEVPAGVSAEDAARLRAVARVGTACADVTVKAKVAWRGDVQCHPFDFGTMGASIAELLYLTNTGYSPAGLTDALTLAPPFGWTAGGAYPGGAGTVSANGVPYDFCGASLPAGGTCVLSVSYAPTAAGSGTVTLAVADAYTPSVDCELHGAPTTRALLTVSEDSSFFGCTDATCGAIGRMVAADSTAAVSLIVSNRGGAPTTALGEGTPLVPPFYWGPDGAGGAFPGGSGVGTANGVDYAYCTTPTLGVGEQCIVTVSFSPTAADTQVETAVSLAYEDAAGPVSPDATRSIVGYLPGPHPTPAHTP
jgi:hypothetical protein